MIQTVGLKQMPIIVYRYLGFFQYFLCQGDQFAAGRFMGFIFFQIPADQCVSIHQRILPGDAWQIYRFEGMKFGQQIGDC